MKKDHAEKLLKLYDSGCEIYYHLRNDDYDGEVPVSISMYEGEITLFSESDHPRASVCYHLKEDDCHLKDFKCYRQQVDIIEDTI